jgi:parallel beta-helix repeat protein
MLNHLNKYKLVLILATFLAPFYFYFKSYSIGIPFDYSCNQSDFFEIDNFARIEAVRMLSYNTSKHFCEITDIALIQESNESKTYDLQLYKGLPELRLRMQNLELIYARNRYLKLMVDNQEDILSFPLSKQNNILKRNIKYIDDYLSYNKVYTELEQLEKGEYELRITSDSNSPVVLKDLGAIFNSKEELEIFHDNVNLEIPSSKLNEYFSRSLFSVTVDSNLEIKNNTKKYIIKGEALTINSISPSFQNVITGRNIQSKDNKFVLLKLPRKFDLNYIDYNLNNFIDDYPEIDFKILSDSLLKIKRGKYNLYRTITMPYGISLEIESGVNLSFQKDVSFVVYGGISLDGTKDNPIIIDTPSSFGVFAAVGNKTSTANINYLHLSGGSEDFINGSYYSGALSLYRHGNVIISNSIISNNLGEDGLNIKSSKVLLKNNIFLSNYSDQVDLDNTTGHVADNDFSVNKENSSNGDGLDLSGSKISIQGNKFNNFKDKGISVGEESISVIYENIFSNNENGMAIKDSSKVFLKENTFKNNEVDINMYVKKYIFNDPILYILDKESFKGSIKSDTRKNIFYNLKNNLWISINEIYDANPQELYFLSEELN